MMRSDWRIAAVAAALMMIGAGCGGKGAESFTDDDSEDPTVEATPKPGGAPTLIEFVGDTDEPASDGQTVFEPSIGPVGSSNPQGSLVRFRVLNAEGRPAQENARVLFSIEGPADATLTLTKDHTHNGFVETVLTAGATPGNAVVVARVHNTNLVARSAVIAIGRQPGAAVSIEFFTLRVPGLIGGEDDEPGTPQSRTLLGIRGSGARQSVDVVFAVFDANGSAAADGTIVDFSLFGPNGGEFITPTSVPSSKGFVSATVNTGTRPGPVEVTAQVRGTSVRARAIPLTIGSALNPVGSNTNIAARCLNVAGLVTFGLLDDIRAGLFDQFGNQIPLGSAVSFFSEGGAMIAQGLTADGIAAHANLVTQEPLPADHRVTVMAVTTGQERFTDVNGNSRFDAGEPFVDLPAEVFLDANEDDAYNVGEFFLDTNNNGVYDGTSNGVWDEQILIEAHMPIIFSGHTQIEFLQEGFELDANETTEITVIISDEFGQPLVGGSHVTVNATNATAFPTEFDIPDSNFDTRGLPVPGLTEFKILVTNPTTPPAEGAPPLIAKLATLTVRVESEIASIDTTCPGGNGSVFSSIIGTVFQ